MSRRGMSNEAVVCSSCGRALAQLGHLKKLGEHWICIECLKGVRDGG